MLFRLKKKVGNHVERDKKGKPKVYKAGDVVESKQDLVRLFSGKFDRVDGGNNGPGLQAVPNIPMPSKGVDLEQLAPLQQPKTTPATDEGTDITDSFMNAKELGVQVFERADEWCDVVVNGNVINEALRKNKVQEYLDEMD